MFFLTKYSILLSLTDYFFIVKIVSSNINDIPISPIFFQKTKNIKYYFMRIFSYDQLLIRSAPHEMFKYKKIKIYS